VKLRTKKVLAVLLTVALLMSQFLVATAASHDYDGHWASATIERGMAEKVINGYLDGTFRPNNAVSRAEFVTMANNLFKFQAGAAEDFTDVKATDWHAVAVERAAAEGLIQGFAGKFRPNDNITRQEAATVLMRAFKLEAKAAGSLNTFADKAKVATWAKEAMESLVSNGYMKGRDGGLLAPLENLSRAEAITLLLNIAGELVQTAETVTDDFAGNVVVNKAGVTLKDSTIAGNLYVAQGVGDGELVLDNVTLTGKLVVMGGGMNSIIIRNSNIGALMVVKTGGTVRVVAVGSTEVGTASILSGGKLEEENLTGEGFGDVEIIMIPAGETFVLEGDFDSVTVETPVADLTIDGAVTEMTVLPAAAGTEMTITATGSVGTLNLQGETTVEGTGTVTKLVVSESGSTLTMTPATVDVVGDVSVVIGNTTVTEDTTTPATTPSTGGSSGSTTTYVDKTFTISTSVDTIPVAVRVPTGSTNAVVVDQIVDYMVTEFDDLYTENAELFDLLAVFEGVETSAVIGTVFESAQNELSAFQTNATDANKKALYLALLQAVQASDDTAAEIDLMEADMVDLVAGVDFGDVTFNGVAFESATVSIGGSEVASYAVGGDKEALVNALFDAVRVMSVSSGVNSDASIVMVADGDTRTISVTD
jgi:hypothetical protein